jgi:hypothetical protein
MKRRTLQYVINITDEVDFGKLRPGGEPASRELKVTVDGLESLGEGSLAVKINSADDEFMLKTASGAELPFTVSRGGSSIGPGNEFCEFTSESASEVAGTLAIDPDDIRFAGSYTGIMIFNCVYEEGGGT